MRIRLKKGKQTELILLAKKEKTWKELSKELEIKEGYLSHEIKKEIVLISENLYKRLGEISNSNFDGNIIEKLDDNWGKSKGGIESSKNSKGSLKEIKIPERDEKLAELIGIILGDGNINFYKKGKKIGVYQVTITGHKELDKNYHLEHITNLFQELFQLKTKESISKNTNARTIKVSSLKLVNFLLQEGLKSGDKIRSQVTIPDWIKEKDEFLKACLRGLIDTDGSIFKMSNKDPNLLRINLTNYNLKLLEDSREGFIKLGFYPSKIIKNRQFFISRKDNISKYLKEIGFSNKKHKDRLRIFQSLVE